jgi:serine protease Do
MTLHQKILTGSMLILTGVLIGMIFMIYYAGINQLISNEVRVTEVKRSVSYAEDSEILFSEAPRLSLRDVAQIVNPTVVYIETVVSYNRSGMPNDENHELDENLLERFLPRRRASTIGSGVLVSSDGYIITNNHVISGADVRSITVSLNDKRVYNATIVGRDPSTDLAVLKIEGEQLPHVVIGDSDALEVGDVVIAIGNPFRLRSTVTAGIVSALGRNVDIINDQMRIESFIQTDAAINRGNSGGALVNEYGELIGINTAIATENGAYQGYGFAIPINMAFKITRDLIEFGEVRRAYLGVQIVAIGQDRAKQLGLIDIKGVEIVNLVRDGSASRAGLRVNDVIMSVNGGEVNEANELQAKIALYRPGEHVQLSVWRDGRSIDVRTTLLGIDNDNIRTWLNR